MCDAELDRRSVYAAQYKYLSGVSDEDVEAVASRMAAAAHELQPEPSDATGKTKDLEARFVQLEASLLASERKRRSAEIALKVELNELRRGMSKSSLRTQGRASSEEAVKRVPLVSKLATTPICGPASRSSYESSPTSPSNGRVRAPVRARRTLFPSDQSTSRGATVACLAPTRLVALLFLACALPAATYIHAFARPRPRAQSPASLGSPIAARPFRPTSLRMSPAPRANARAVFSCGVRCFELCVLTRSCWRLETQRAAVARAARAGPNATTLASGLIKDVAAVASGLKDRASLWAAKQNVSGLVSGRRAKLALLAASHLLATVLGAQLTARTIASRVGASFARRGEVQVPRPVSERVGGC